MKKGFAFMLMIMCAEGILISCSKDEEQNPVINHAELDRDTLLRVEGLKIVFQLQDMDGMAVKSFKEGDNMMFRLIINNETDKGIKMPSIRELTGFDIFHIYSSDGKDLGLPWDYMGTIGNPLWMGYSFELSTKATLPFICYWYENGNSKPSDLGHNTPRQPLAKGNYYTEFELTLDESVKVKLHKDFTIK